MKKKKAPVHSPAAPPAATAWTFLTNHAHVLWCLFRQQDLRLRDVATLVGITERMVQRIVTELAEAGYLVIEKQGRRNVYAFHVDRALRHPLEAHCQVGDLLDLFAQARGKR